jgi:TonB family protein
MRILLIAISIFFMAYRSTSQPAACSFQTQRAELTVALLFEGERVEAVESALKGPMPAQGFSLQEQSIVDGATKALQLPNLLNLSRNQARNFGLALGVDIFVVARTRLVERTGVGANLYGECYVAVGFVGTRSGQLLVFDFIETRASTTGEALALAASRIKEHSQFYAERMRAGFKEQFEAKRLSAEDSAAIELPEEDSESDIEPPTFSSRQQPEYTETARKMGISAVVEIEAVLRRDGTIGNTEVMRWAGFGLDESAVAAVRHLKFKPATMKNLPVSCRALIRYNFNYKIQ